MIEKPVVRWVGVQQSRHMIRLLLHSLGGKVQMTRKPYRGPTYLVPVEFDAEGVVGPLKADAGRWLVSTVLRKLTVNDVDARGFAILSSTILERVMGRGYARIVKRLADAGVLLRSSYSEGRSFGYRLSDEYLVGKPRWVPVTNPVMLDRLKREQQRLDAEQAQRRLPVHDALDEAQRGMTVLPAAHDAVERLRRKSQLCQRVHIDRLERGDLPLTISTTQRLFNGLSGVKSDLREFVRLDGEPLGNVDIVNSQPALLANLLTHGFPHDWGKRVPNIKIHLRCPSPLPFRLPPFASAGSAAAFDSFASVASSGMLYDELALSFCGDRDWVKKRFLVDVLAKRGSYPSPVENEFRRRFPETWEAIQRINGDSHFTLIRLLQRLESWLVVERIAGRLVDRIPVVSLHDALYSTRGDVEKVASEFRSVFEELNFQMELKVK